MPRILITGSQGQIGTELAEQLRLKYGQENVICTDIQEAKNQCQPFYHLDVLKRDDFEHLISSQDIDWLIHNASILSATGEKHPHLAMNVNIKGFDTAIEIAREHDLRIISPSSIAAFGPSTPKENTPDDTIMRPTTIYGVSKVYVELLGEYYHQKWGVDFRTLRYPGIISWKTPPMHGTTDYAVAIFHEALKHKKYISFLAEDALLPMMYMPDCLKGTIELLEADASKLSRRTYNLGGFSFAPRDIAASIQKHIPEFEISYQPDYRQQIAESWPNSLDDSNARRDWNWMPRYTLDTMVEDMLANLSQMLGIEY
ncbi:MAG: NAD-dependent epimerase/dehydratase family protein [Candidatus Heimdallarchaeota archaeon]|nr:NAD-dependent epimerase/dehydratase family protein [Candidatus Heimdallarchaeota archaeon]